MNLGTIDRRKAIAIGAALLLAGCKVIPGGGGPGGGPQIFMGGAHLYGFGEGDFAKADAAAAANGAR